MKKCSRLLLEDKEMDRREMMRITAAGGVAGVLGLGMIGPASVARAESDFKPFTSGPGYVIRVHQPGMKQGAFPNPKAARVAVDKAVMTLSGESDPGRAWLRFVSPTDRVGIKINCLGTRFASSMKEIVFAVADSIREAGVPDANIVIIDMFASNMMGGRYDQQHNPNRMRVFAHKEGKYQKSWIHAGPARVKFADIYMWTTAIINIPVIKDHDLAGVTCCLKNMTFGVVEKPHVNHTVVNEAIAHLWALEDIRSKVRLNIVDGSSILYDGGPWAKLSRMVTHDSIYATTDPVAMDTIAGELIENLRAENKLMSLAKVGRPPKYLGLSEQLGLGIGDRNKIHLRTVELLPYQNVPSTG